MLLGYKPIWDFAERSLFFLCDSLMCMFVCLVCYLFVTKKNVADDYGELLVDTSSWFWWLSSFIALKWLLLSSASSLLLQFFHFIWLYGIKKAKKKIKIFPHSNHRNIIMWSTFFGSNQVKFFFIILVIIFDSIWFKFLMSISVYVLFYNPIQFFFVFFILFVSFSSPHSPLLFKFIDLQSVFHHHHHHHSDFFIFYSTYL